MILDLVEFKLVARRFEVVVRKFENVVKIAVVTFFKINTSLTNI